MYKVIGVDGKEYGPVSLQQMQQWINQGRVNASTRVKEDGGTEWRAASQIPEIQALFAVAGSQPPLPPPPMPGSAASVPGVGQQTGLAVTSLVLGILSFLCGLLAGIPALICGHIAYNRARRAPAQYGGAGMAIAGLILGYFSLVLTVLILPALLLPALSRAKSKAQSINCANNLKQIGLAYKVWALDHKDQFLFNVSTNEGGTLELCARGSDGFDRNGYVHFQVLSNELSTPIILVCPADTKSVRAADFRYLQANNLTYLIRSGPSVNETNPQQVLAVCPFHDNALMVDGSVQSKRRVSPPPRNSSP